MNSNAASRIFHAQPLLHSPFGRRNRPFSALFEKQRKQIERQEREIERLRRELDEAQKRVSDDEKKITELEKENSKLKRDLEARTCQTQKSDSLSTPSGMQPVYSKPSASRHRRRKPGRKKGHLGARRPAPVQIDRVVEHKLAECPTCHNALGKPCGKHSQIVEDIPPVKPEVTEHVIYEYRCAPCRTKVAAPMTEALPKATLGLRLTLLSAFLLCPRHEDSEYLHLAPNFLPVSGYRWRPSAELAAVG